MDRTTPPPSFHFGQLRATFERFAATVDDDPDGGFLLYLRCKELAALVGADGADAPLDGGRAHFDEEAGRVLGWMRYKIGFDETPGYCPDYRSARLALTNAVRRG
jgi:hypothetical protein